MQEFRWQVLLHTGCFCRASPLGTDGGGEYSILSIWRGLRIFGMQNWVEWKHCHSEARVYRWSVDISVYQRLLMVIAKSFQGQMIRFGVTLVLWCAPSDAPTSCQFTQMMIWSETWGFRALFELIPVVFQLADNQEQQSQCSVPALQEGCTDDSCSYLWQGDHKSGFWVAIKPCCGAASLGRQVRSRQVSAEVLITAVLLI